MRKALVMLDNALQAVFACPESIGVLPMKSYPVVAADFPKPYQVVDQPAVELPASWHYPAASGAELTIRHNPDLLQFQQQERPATT